MNQPGATCRVLLVDDEVDFASALALRLARRGFVTDVAHDGEAALAAARVAPPDVVLLDVQLPGDDGVAVLARLKREHPASEIILLTGHASAGSGLHGMRLGAFDYVLKPVAIEELCERLQAAWARRRARAAPAASG
ncbi:MAG TPA: response regulator [Polyangia bacterium]|jgi:DNA-binding response OmpR family regulator